VFTRFLGRTDSLTHSLMDRPEYSMPLAPFFNGSGGIKILCITEIPTSRSKHTWN